MAGCTATEPIAVDGATGLIGADDCDTRRRHNRRPRLLDRVYTRKSEGDPAAVAPYDRAWFEEVLATVQLQPEDAVDVAPSASPDPNRWRAASTAARSLALIGIERTGPQFEQFGFPDRSYLSRSRLDGFGEEGWPMTTSRRRFNSLSAALVALALVSGCAPSSTIPAAAFVSKQPVSVQRGRQLRRTGSLVIVGRIVTMDEPPVAEALLIEDGTVAASGLGTRSWRSPVSRCPSSTSAQNVAYPGFIDAHAHWIGDRNYYSLETPADAMDAAATRGWTSISEQWINQEKLDLLLGLAGDDALQLRVDAYLALNFDKEFFGDWYESREPGPVDDRLRVQGLKIHLDDGGGNIINWEPAELTATIGRANEAGWQVSVHAMSSEAMELVLDAFEAAIGPSGPNPLHHRIEHALQVTDEHLARMVAMDIATVIHLEGASDWMLDQGLPGRGGPRRPGAARLARALARFRRRRAPCRLGNRRAVDLSGLRADRRHGPARRPDRRRNGRPASHETGDAAMGSGPAADRRAGTARGHPGRGLGPGRRGAARPPGAGNAGRRHDPERRRHRPPPPTRSAPCRSSPRSSAESLPTAATRRSAPRSRTESSRSWPDIRPLIESQDQASNRWGPWWPDSRGGAEMATKSGPARPDAA